MVMPGDNVNLEVELLPIAMEEGQRFAIREGGRTVGAGVVTKIAGKILAQEINPDFAQREGFRPVAQLAERRSQNRRLGVRFPWPATQGLSG